MLKSEKATYYSAAMDDRNRAPASIAPPKDAGTSSKVDPLHLRSQADYHFALAETYSLAGDSKKAIEEFRLTLIYDPDSASVRTRLADQYYKMGMMSEAMKQAELAVELDDKGTQQRVLLGRLYTGLKMFDKALAQYEKVAELDPENSDAPLFVGAILAEKGDYEKAIAHFENLAKDSQFERTYLAYFYLGRIHQQKTEDESSLRKAEKAYEKSLSLDPEFEDSLIALARLYIFQDKKEAAIKMLDNYQKKHGPSEIVADLMVNLYMEDERFDEAFEQFEILEAKNPKDVNVKYKMALILMDRKEYKKAIQYMKTILKQEPRLDKIRFYLAAVYEELKRDTEAVTHFMQIPAGSQYYPDAVVHSAYIFKNQGNHKQAIDVVQKAIGRRDDVPEFYTMYASLLDETKEYKKALVMLADATKKFVDNTQLIFYLGSIQDKVGDVEATVSSMKRVIEIDPNHVQALNYLAYTYAEKNMELEEAEVLVRRALELTPDDGYIMDTLGWVLFKKGEVKDAVSVLERAYELKNTESIIAEHLGDAYYRYQLPEKAKEMYMRAVEVESSSETIRKLQQKIADIQNQTDVPNRLPASSGP